MTGKRLEPFSRRLTDLKNWRQLPENLQRLEAACKAGKVRTADARHLLTVLVVATDKHSGIVAQSIGQLADETGLPEFTVRRALKALESAAVISTVWKGRPAADGKGKPSGRKVLFLAGDISDKTDKSVHQIVKDRALDSERPCTQVHATMTDITMKTIPMSLAISETGEKGKGALNSEQWSADMAVTVTDQLVKRAAAAGLMITSPAGFRKHQQPKAQKAVEQVLSRFGLGVCSITPADYEHSDLLTVLVSWASDQTVTGATCDMVQAAANRHQS